MNSTILQVPITKKLREQAAVAAVAQGFSSVQEAVRVFLTQLADRSLQVTFEPKPVKLSAKNEKRYRAMEADFAKGRNIQVANNVDELMQQLHDHSTT